MTRVHAINIKLYSPGQRGIPKKSVGWARVTEAGVTGDFNRYRQEAKSGTLDRAVLLLPYETIQDLNAEGWPVKPGDLGENITTIHKPYGSFACGQAYRIGTDAVVRVTEPCHPCNNLKFLDYIGDDRVDEFVRTLVGRRGWYASVISDGIVKRDDPLVRLS